MSSVFTRLTKFFAFSGLIFAGLYPAAAVAVPMCQTGSLASYVALDTTGGCMIPDNAVPGEYFTFFRFTDPTPTTVGTVTPATASQILVTPLQTSTGAGFSFSAMSGGGNLFSLSSSSGTASVTYYINYTVDPAPTVGDAELALDPPYGNVYASQTYCAFDVLIDGCPNGTEYHQTVTPANPLAYTQFANSPQFVDIDTDIFLSATPGNPASIDSVNAYVDTPGLVSSTPEPSALLLTSAPLLFLFLARRKRSRKSVA